MQLYYWTEHEYDTCSHYAAFADDEATARAFVIEGIRQTWVRTDESGSDPDPDDLAWAAKSMNRQIEDFNSNPKWKLSVHDIAPGIVIC